MLMFYVSETWLSSNTPDSFINIPDSNVLRFDNGRGAGVCIFVKDTFTSNVVMLDIDRPAGLENVWVAVQCRKLSAVIMGGGVPPSKSTSCLF